MGSAAEYNLSAASLPGVAASAAPAGQMDQQALIAYLLSRGYSSALAPQLAKNMIANPTYEGNAEMIQAASKAHVNSWAADKLAQAGAQPAAVGGAGAQAIASHFQRQGYSPEEAITLAYHAVGAPTAQTPTGNQIGAHFPLEQDTVTSEPPPDKPQTLSEAEIKRLQGYVQQLPSIRTASKAKIDKLAGAIKSAYPDDPEIEMKEGD